MHVATDTALRKITLSHDSGSVAQLHTQGAQITSWRDAKGRERLYLSERSPFRSGMAIRGGIPVMFPQFGAGVLPKHGFARVREWTLLEHGPARGGASLALLELRDDDATRALWPHGFRLTLTATLLEMALDLRLHVTNTGDDAFTFTTALHNYLHVDDANMVRVEGLTGCAYHDKVRGVDTRDAAPVVWIAGETDRVYAGAPAETRVVDGAHTLLQRVTGFADRVVWNPWAELTRTLSDMQPDDYVHMLCVEAAQIWRPVTLAPGGEWIGTQTLSAG